MWEIQAGEIAVKYFSRFIVGKCRFCFCLERTEVNRFSDSVDRRPYRRIPTIPMFMPTDSLIFGRTSFPLCGICMILRLCCDSQIRFSVVEPIPINVINYERFWRIQYKALHLDCFPLTAFNPFMTRCIPRIAKLDGIPRITQNTWCIFCINDSHHAIAQFDLGNPTEVLPLGERNSYHGSVTKKNPPEARKGNVSSCRVAARPGDEIGHKNTRPLIFCVRVFLSKSFMFSSPARVSRVLDSFVLYSATKSIRQLSGAVNDFK